MGGREQKNLRNEVNHWLEDVFLKKVYGNILHCNFHFKLKLEGNKATVLPEFLFLVPVSLCRALSGLGVPVLLISGSSWVSDVSLKSLKTLGLYLPIA